MEAESMNESSALVLYDESGKPLAFIIKDNENYDDELIAKLMEAFNASENAETFLRWKEVS